MREELRVGCRVSLWGDDSTSSTLLALSRHFSARRRNTRMYLDWLSYPTRVFYTATEYPTKQCILEILRNILYRIEYSSDHTRGSAGCPTSQNMAYLSEMPQMSNSQILSNILYPIEYSYAYTEVPAGYPTFSIAYLIYSTLQQQYVQYKLQPTRIILDVFVQYYSKTPKILSSMYHIIFFATWYIHDYVWYWWPDFVTFHCSCK